MGDRETRFKLILHYDGSSFRGWQSQPGAPTVQGEIEAAIVQLTGERRPVVGSGRTDTGVHATGQVAAVTMPARWTAQAFCRSLNALLPDAVWVREVMAVHDGFHPRRDAVERSYAYRVGSPRRLRPRSIEGGAGRSAARSTWKPRPARPTTLPASTSSGRSPSPASRNGGMRAASRVRAGVAGRTSGRSSKSPPTASFTGWCDIWWVRWWTWPLAAVTNRKWSSCCKVT